MVDLLCFFQFSVLATTPLISWPPSSQKEDQPAIPLYIFNCITAMALENGSANPSKRPTAQQLSLISILTCPLCSSKAKSAHICPNCSKFYCESCIKSWIVNSSHTCPHCQNYLEEGLLVNCTKLSLELSFALEAFIQHQVPQPPACALHMLTQNYYCLECKGAICADCIVVEGGHQGHAVKKLKEVKVQFNDQVSSVENKIKNCCKDIERIRDQANALKTNHTKHLKGKLQQLNSHMLKVRTSYQQHTNDFIHHFTTLYDANRLEHLSCNKTYEEFRQELEYTPKIELVRKPHLHLEEPIQLLLKQTGQKGLTREQIQQSLGKEDMVLSALTAKFAQQLYVLNDYTRKRQERQVMYSQVFTSGPLAWRLKIYPNGLEGKSERQGSKGPKAQSFGEEYISIYVELVAGVREGARYRFSIGILHENDQSKVISQVYEADFDTGKCWGYDEFANISALYQKGYVHTEEDSIKIAVSVGPPSYYYSTLDLETIIKNKGQTVSANKNKIEELRRKLSGLTHPFPLPQPAQLLQPPISLVKRIESQTKIEFGQNIVTPRNKVQPEASQLHNKRSLQNNFGEVEDFENYVVELVEEDDGRDNEDFNHQSAELRKIYRRFMHLGEKGTNLLLF